MCWIRTRSCWAGAVGNIEELYSMRTREKITAAIFNPDVRGGAAEADAG